MSLWVNYYQSKHNVLGPANHLNSPVHGGLYQYEFFSKHFVVFSIASPYVYACNMIPGTSGMDSTMNKASERSSVVS